MPSSSFRGESEVEFRLLSGDIGATCGLVRGILKYVIASGGPEYNIRRIEVIERNLNSMYRDSLESLNNSPDVQSFTVQHVNSLGALHSQIEEVSPLIEDALKGLALEDFYTIEKKIEALGIMRWAISSRWRHFHESS